jgi:hypothetical protein
MQSSGPSRGWDQPCAATVSDWVLPPASVSSSDTAEGSGWNQPSGAAPRSFSRWHRRRQALPRHDRAPALRSSPARVPGDAGSRRLGGAVLARRARSRVNEPHLRKPVRPVMPSLAGRPDRPSGRRRYQVGGAASRLLGAAEKGGGESGGTCFALWDAGLRIKEAAACSGASTSALPEEWPALPPPRRAFNLNFEVALMAPH